MRQDNPNIPPPKSWAEMKWVCMASHHFWRGVAPRNAPRMGFAWLGSCVRCSPKSCSKNAPHTESCSVNGLFTLRVLICLFWNWCGSQPSKDFVCDSFTALLHDGENCPISGRRKSRKILSRLWLSWFFRSRSSGQTKANAKVKSQVNYLSLHMWELHSTGKLERERSSDPININAKAKGRRYLG